MTSNLPRFESPSLRREWKLISDKQAIMNVSGNRSRPVPQIETLSMFKNNAVLYLDGGNEVGHIRKHYSFAPCAGLTCRRLLFKVGTAAKKYWLIPKNHLGNYQNYTCCRTGLMSSWRDAGLAVRNAPFAFSAFVFGASLMFVN